MSYEIIRGADVPSLEKHGIRVRVYPKVEESGVVLVDTEKGHDQEFKHATSTFTYLVLSGHGSFFVDDEEVSISEGDRIAIYPGSRIYYRGGMRLLLMTTPPWTAEGETETRAHIW